MKFSLWDSKTLLILLAAGQAASLVYASVALDGHADPVLLTIVAIIRGGLVGIGASFAAAFSSYQLPRVKHGQARKIGWTALGGLVACSAVVVGVSGVETPQGALRWIVSIGYSVLTECAVLAVAMASGKLFADVPVEPPQSQPVARPKRERPIEQPALPVIAPAPAAIAIPCKYGCGFERATQQAINAHYRGCKNRPVKIDQSLLINQERAQ